MDSVKSLVAQYLSAAWRRRWMGVIVAWLVCGIGWVGVYTIPNQFESSARLFVDADAVLTPLLRGLAADSAPTTQLEILQRTLLSRPNLEKLISKTDLDLTLNGPTDRERLLSRLATDIKVTPQTRNLFTIAYRDKSPKAGARRRADPADHLRRKRDRRFAHRHGECTPLPGTSDPVL